MKRLHFLDRSEFVFTIYHYLWKCRFNCIAKSRKIRYLLFLHKECIIRLNLNCKYLIKIDCFWYIPDGKKTKCVFIHLDKILSIRRLIKTI